MATQTRMPQPPLPPPSSSFYRRHCVASSSSSSSLSTASSATSSPSPSPHSTATTSVPFSWEHHPGIPKTCLPANPASPPTPLPLPPPLRAPPSRHHHRRRRRASPPPGHAADPFAAALAECTKERPVASGAGGNVIDTLFPTPASGATGGRAGRRWSIAAGGVVGFLDLYGCKSAMAVAEGAFVVRRPVAVARPGPGRPGQGRPGRAGRQ